MTHTYYRSSLKKIPKNNIIIKKSKLPFIINITLQDYNKENIIYSEEDIIRCEKCKTYINPYVEIIPPGHQWKCNMCFSINKVTQPFYRSGDSMGGDGLYNTTSSPYINSSSPYTTNTNTNTNTNTSTFNPLANYSNNKHYNSLELTHTVIDVLASPNYILKSPSPPIYIFIIEASVISFKNGMIDVFIRSVLDNLENVPNVNGRAKFMFMFYNSKLYIIRRGEGEGEGGGSKDIGINKGSNNEEYTNNQEYNTKNTPSLTVISDFSEMPLVMENDFLFSFEEIKNINFNIFKEILLCDNEVLNDLGGVLKFVNFFLEKSGGGGSVLVGMCSVPNIGCGCIDVKDESFLCKNTFYKEIASEFSRNYISISYFLFPNLNMEIPSLSVLSRYTGGVMHYFPNFSCKDELHSCKVYGDMGRFLSMDVGFEGVCRVRMPKECVFKEFYGNFHLKKPDLLSFSNFYACHSFSFEIEICGDLNVNALCVQVACLRTVNEIRKIRILNFCIPVDLKNSVGDFYKNIDFYALVHGYVLKGINNILKNKNEPFEFINKTVKEIYKGYLNNTGKNIGNGKLPEELEEIPLLLLCAYKSVALRTSNYTPMDYKVFYSYLFTVGYPKFIDLLIYPNLIGLHLIYEEIYLNGMDVPVNYDKYRCRLSLDYLEISGFYLLDTGVNIFFFVGSECNNEMVEMLFDSELKSGRINVGIKDNNFSKIVCKMLGMFICGRYLSPNYFYVRDTGESDIYKDIFFSYFLEDSVHGLPSYNEFIKNLRLDG
ncbi:putative Sec24-like protein [Hamiltosporidium tvaerminnensis]|uniref:Putative Sec24-like protein n=2 Tax=Hamiltosporidium tvaerminnensis TaxID=1176355 RepID=A0A4Q9LWS2_9MICR|nr:putative Sec24-like protein [Hamiltosporidium tvaerminnensis]